jgi:hypothetical protein
MGADTTKGAAVIIEVAADISDAAAVAIIKAAVDTSNAAAVAIVEAAVEDVISVEKETAVVK